MIETFRMSTMLDISSDDLKRSVENVVERLTGISELYPVQIELLTALMKKENIIFTSCTNSGKTLPAVLYPYILEELGKLGYEVPSGKTLCVTALNSIKLSMVTTVKSLGLNCEAITSDKYKKVISSSEVKILFVSPEVLKISQVSACLLAHRHAFVLKVIDECHLGEYFLLIACVLWW